MTTHQNLRSEFLRSVKLGTGRAYLVAQANPDVDFSAAISKAAVRNFAYDGQCEGSRAQYVYGLYCLSAHQAAIRRAVRRGLAREQDDTWTLAQLFELALFFAQDGDAEAQKTLYKQFLNKPDTSADWLGAKEIMTLDGWAGLVYIARKFGQALARNSGGWQDDFLINSFQKKYPAVDAWAGLRQLAEQDADVRRYVQNVETTMAKSADYKRPDRAFDLEEALRRPHQRYLFFRTIRTLQPTDLQQLAERLLTEKDKNVRENLLFIFAHRPYPLDYRPLLALAQQKPSRYHRFAEFATKALQHLQSPEIRAFALRRLAITTQPARYTDMLTNNYQVGDAQLLTTVVNRFHNEHIIEQLACSYIQIYQANSTPECAAPLLALYYKMTCGIHRSDVVKLLINNNVLPSQVNEELLFDSSEETRLLHQQSPMKSAPCAKSPQSNPAS